MIYRGVKYSKDIQIKNRSTGLPVDISTWQFSSDIRDDAGDIVFPTTTGTGNWTVIDGTNGWLRFSLTTTNTDALSVGPIGAGLFRTDESDGPSRLGRWSEQVSEKD